MTDNIEINDSFCRINAPSNTVAILPNENNSPVAFSNALTSYIINAINVFQLGVS